MLNTNSGITDRHVPLLKDGIWICIVVGCTGLLICGAMLREQSQRPVLAALPERINPNTAELGSLVRLPNIGKARATDLINYREQFGPEQTAFKSLGDLENINGIGPKTAAAMEPWLTFEQEPRLNTNDANFLDTD